MNKIKHAYKKYKISYKLNGVDENFEYTTGLEMTKDLAVTIIFKQYFPAQYEEDRIKAEETLVKIDKVEFIGLSFSDIKWEEESRRAVCKLTHSLFRKSEDIYKEICKRKQLNKIVYKKHLTQGDNFNIMGSESLTTSNNY